MTLKKVYGKNIFEYNFLFFVLNKSMMTKYVLQCDIVLQKS